MKLTTPTMQVFDPAMCCSTGVCGPEVDTKLVQFAADLEWLKTQDVLVQRHNLSQNPAAFVENTTVQSTLREKGEAACKVVGQHSRRTAMVPWAAEEPAGPERLQQFFKPAPLQCIEP